MSLTSFLKVAEKLDNLLVHFNRTKMISEKQIGRPSVNELKETMWCKRTAKASLIEMAEQKGNSGKNGEKKCFTL